MAHSTLSTLDKLTETQEVVPIASFALVVGLLPEQILQRRARRMIPAHSVHATAGRC